MTATTHFSCCGLFRWKGSLYIRLSSKCKRMAETASRMIFWWAWDFFAPNQFGVQVRVKKVLLTFESFESLLFWSHTLQLRTPCSLNNSYWKTVTRKILLCFKQLHFFTQLRMLSYYWSSFLDFLENSLYTKGKSCLNFSWGKWWGFSVTSSKQKCPNVAFE